MALIEREALKICKHGNGYGYCFLYEEYCLEEPCKEEEVVEYAPVVHGRWIHDMGNLYGCSECMKRETMSPKKLKNYCPSCGARMNGGEEHEAD